MPRDIDARDPTVRCARVMESLGSRSAIAPAVVKTAAQKKYPKPRPRVLARARSDANDDASEAKKQAVAGA